MSWIYAESGYGFTLFGEPRPITRAFEVLNKERAYKLRL